MEVAQLQAECLVVFDLVQRCMFPSMWQLNKQSQQWNHDKCKYEDTITTLRNKIEMASLEVEAKNTQFTQLNHMLG